MGLNPRRSSPQGIIPFRGIPVHFHSLLQTTETTQPWFKHCSETYSPDHWGVSSRSWCWGEVCLLPAAGVRATTASLTEKLPRNEDAQEGSLNTPFFLSPQLPPTSQLPSPAGPPGWSSVPPSALKVCSGVWGGGPWSWTVHNTRMFSVFSPSILL